MPHGSRARHVVFADALRWQRRIDLAPREGLATGGKQAPFQAEDGAFVRWLFREAGLEARHYRAEALQRRLPSCLRAIRVSSATEARYLLEENRSLIALAVSAMLIGVTAFFRDPSVFATVDGGVLPALLAGRRPLRVWSVGCSDGAEAYSVAILLAERGMLERTLLLGTDCRPDAIVRARAGIFDARSVGQVPETLREKHFERVDGGSRIRERLRAAITWRTGNVMELPEPGAWDLILCRNVAIYMEAGASAALWRTLEGCLRPGGTLVVGKAERPTDAKGLVAMAPSVYRRERL